MISYCLKNRIITIYKIQISHLKIKMITTISIIINCFIIRINIIKCDKKMIIRNKNISIEWKITQEMQCSSINNSKTNNFKCQEINNKYTLLRPVQTLSALEISIIFTSPNKGNRGSSLNNSRKKILSRWEWCEKV